MLNGKHMVKVIALLSVALVAGLAVTACGSAASGPATVLVTLGEWKVNPNAISVPAGKVTFQVTNQGTLEHEMVLLKTDAAPNALEMSTTEQGKAEEESTDVKDVGEVDEVAAGTTKIGTFDLAPGKYVLICNVAGHYQAGMETAFVVN